MTQLPHFQMYIDGAWTEGDAGQTMATQNPATGEDWATFACAAPADVDRAILGARRALNNPTWRDMTQTKRGKLLYRLAELIEENAQELGRLETTDSGKLLTETSTQTAYVGDYYRYYAGLADKIEGAVLPIDKPDMHVFTRREPIGVVVAIVPWNAQMFLTATKLGHQRSHLSRCSRLPN
jgi:acyl-CoA reductase-like NAD-dependent aldehyde dehydrogenase